MDPELKAATRGLKAGSREYQKAVEQYMSRKAERESAAADAANARENARLDAEAARKRQADAAQAEKDRVAGMVAGGTAAGGLGAGFVGGRYADKLATGAADRVLTSRAEGLGKLAASARAIDPTAPNAQGLFRDIGNAAQKSGVTNPRVAPFGTGLTGLGLIGAGLYSNIDRVPKSQSDIERGIWTGAGYGEMGAGAKMLADSARRYRNPNITLPADDLAAVEGARRMGAAGRPGPVAPPSTAMGWAIPPAPPQGGMPSAPPPAQPPAAPPAEPVGPQRHSDRLIAAARAADASGKLNKETAAAYLAKGITDANRGAVGEALGVKPGPNFGKRIAAAIEKMSSKSGRFALPLAAGVYAASTTESEAGDGSDGSSLANQAIAGGAAAGGVAGGQYLMSKLPQSISSAFGAGAPGFAPGTVDSMTDYSPDELAQGRNFLAQNLPSWLRAGAVEDAYQMAQVPPRNPLRQQQSLPYGAMGFGMPPR